MSRYFTGFSVRDSSHGLSDLPSWTQITGTGDKATFSTVNSYMAIQTSATPDAVYLYVDDYGQLANYVEYVTRGGQSSGDRSFPCVMASDATGDNMLLLRHQIGKLQVFSYTSGSFDPILNDVTHAVSAGDKIRMTITGTTYQVSVNGSDIGGTSGTVPASLQSNTRVGMWFRNTGGTQIASDADAWETNTPSSVSDWNDTIDTGKTLTTGLQRLVVPLQAGGVGEIASSSTVTTVKTPTEGTTGGWPETSSNDLGGEGYDIAGDPSITGDYTLICRVQHNGTTGDFEHFWSGFPAWAFTTNDGANLGYPAFRDSTGTYINLFDDQPTIGEATTFAATRSGSSGKLFVDGLLVDTFTDSGTLSAPDSTAYGFLKYAGSSTDFSSNATNFFAGAWNVALADADVAKLTTPEGLRAELFTSSGPPPVGGIPKTIGVTPNKVIGLDSITDIIGVS